MITRPGPSCSVRMLMAEARIGDVERIDALALIGHGLGRTRAWLIAHDDAVVNEVGAAYCRDLLNRRMLGEPVAYLIEAKEFHGLPLRVTPEVLIPRDDTETLVDWALELLEGPLARLDAPRVLDLGTGSGAIALAIKHMCARARVTAVDRSPGALEVARSNAVDLELDVSFVLSDWGSSLGDACFDLIVSNPPYIAIDDPHLRALAHEPVAALVAGPQGLDDLRRIADAAPRILAPSGWLLLEHGYDQGPSVRALFEAARWQAVETRRDLGRNERCTGARRVT